VSFGSEGEDEFEELPEEGSYTCSACGEEIVIPIDLSAGRSQEYVEDCPVCCHPNVIRLSFESDLGFQIDAEGE